MAISEAGIRKALESFVEPYLGRTLAESGALRAFELQGDRLDVKLELGLRVGVAEGLADEVGL